MTTGREIASNLPGGTKHIHVSAFGIRSDPHAIRLLVEGLLSELLLVTSLSIYVHIIYVNAFLAICL